MFLQREFLLFISNIDKKTTLQIEEICYAELLRSNKMSSYKATINWQRKPDDKFIDKKYSRIHEWSFESGIKIPASPSHHIVPVPYSNPDHIDPEEAFVASLSSCHMLTFLDLCSRNGIIVNDYRDAAEGILERIGRNKWGITKVTLKPVATYGNDVPPSKEICQALHHQAHEMCFIANSVTTEITTEIIS